MWVAVFVVAVVYTACRLTLSILGFRAVQSGDTARAERLAALVFGLRVATLGAVLLGLCVLIAVALIRR